MSPQSRPPSMLPYYPARISSDSCSTCALIPVSVLRCCGRLVSVLFHLFIHLFFTSILYAWSHDSSVHRSSYCQCRGSIVASSSSNVRRSSKPFSILTKRRRKQRQNPPANRTTINKSIDHENRSLDFQCVRSSRGISIVGLFRHRRLVQCPILQSHHGHAHS